MLAQQLVVEATAVRVTPASLTSSGKAMLVTWEAEGHTELFTIYDDDMQVVRQVRAEIPIKRISYQEYAVVQPTSIRFTLVEKEPLPGYSMEGITTSWQLASWLNKNLRPDNEPEFTGFTDAEGYIAACNASSDFYLPGYFGKIYPYEYYRIVDGMLERIIAKYEPLFNAEQAEWHKIEGSEQDLSSYRELKPIPYTDYDTGQSYRSCPFTLSQTLFNDDDSWEYVSPNYQLEVIVGDYRLDYNYDSEQGVGIVRTVEECDKEKGVKIVSENGEVLATFMMEGVCYDFEVWKLNRKIYIFGRDNKGAHLYHFDTATSSIQSVCSVKQQPRFVHVDGMQIELNLSDKQGGDAVLTDMSGRTLMRSTLPKGQEQAVLRTSGLTRGAYTVSRIQQGKVLQSEKVIVK